MLGLHDDVLSFIIFAVIDIDGLSFNVDDVLSDESEELPPGTVGS